MSANEPVFLMYWWEWAVDIGMLFFVVVSAIGFWSYLRDIEDAGEYARKQMKEKEKRP